LLSALTSFAGTVGAALVKLAPTIASTLAKIAPALSKIAGPILELAPKIGEVITTVVKVVNEISQLLGVVNPTTKADELGERALQHPEIHPDDYETTKEYIAKLESADFDSKKFEALTPGERAMATAVGSGLELKGLCEKFAMNIPAEIFSTAVRGGLGTNDLVKLLTALSSNGIRDAALVVQYFAGGASPSVEKLAPAFKDYEASGGKPISEIEANLANAGSACA